MTIKRSAASSKNFNSLPRRISKLLAGFAIVALAITASRWLGAAWEATDVIQQAAPLWPILALCALLPLWFIRREASWRLPTTCGIIFASVAIILLSLPFFPNWPAPTSAHRPLRIVALNLWYKNRDPVAAAAWIRGQNPDVVVLLEVGGRAAAIARNLAPTFPYRTTCRLERFCSTQILSRIPPIERRGLAHGDADNRKALSAALVRFGAPWPSFAVVAVHLSHPSPQGAQHREIEALSAGLASEPRERLIVTGDFNATPWSGTIRRIASALGVRPIGGEAPSWPAPPSGSLLPAIFSIDHTLLGPGWAAASSVRGPAVGSDHYPFTITLVPGDSDVDG